MGSRKPRRANHWRHIRRRQMVFGRGTFGSAKLFGSKFLSSRKNCSADWPEFLGFFERFTDALVVAAKDGCSEKLEREYQAVREWIGPRYYRIAEMLRPYLHMRSASPKASRLRVRFKTKRQCSKRENLQELFAQGTIKDLLGNDSGLLISRLSRLSDAVYLCDTDWKRRKSNMSDLVG
jgi:hypothetical protein